MSCPTTRHLLKNIQPNHKLNVDHTDGLKNCTRAFLLLIIGIKEVPKIKERNILTRRLSKYCIPDMKMVINVRIWLLPVWHLMWFKRCSFLVNGFEQTVQQWGVSPVCCRRWLVKCSFRVKVLLQKSHRCGDSPVWIRTWFTRCSFLVKVFEQKWHLKLIWARENWNIFGLFEIEIPVGRLSSVLPDVVGEVLLPGKGFGAVLALVRRLSSVLPHVIH